MKHRENAWDQMIFFSLHKKKKNNTVIFSICSLFLEKGSSLQVEKIPSVQKCQFYAKSISWNVRFIIHSSKKLYGWRDLPCKELWDHPWSAHIQTLLQLDSTSLGMRVGSSMIQGSSTSSFSLQHTPLGSLLVHSLLLKTLHWLQILFSCFQVNENPLLYWFCYKLEKRIVWENSWI